ncbi:GNAT family N-acetyltransferase [Flavobacteriaceae bacterium SZ-1-7]|uniref:GNAT family N-acetyltransferase n=1 Tax=Tamlana sedimenti TaxID=3134126 RepID=UPI003128D6A5
MILKRHQFIWDFYKCSKGIIPSCLSQVLYGGITFENPNTIKKNELPKVCYISIFPSFLTPKLIDEDQYKLTRVKHYGMSCSAMVVSNSNSVEEYLTTYTQKSLRVKLKRAIKKLESAYTVKYEYNHGAISDEKCKSLLNDLNQMINLRFSGRINEHIFLMEWDKNTQDLAVSIREKKSSLFVVYADDKPISISVKRHINKTILFSETHSFDVNFKKYGLGDIDKYMTVDWAIKNKYPIIDLGIGVTPFKRKWCNFFYDKEYLVFYRKKSVMAYVVAKFEIGKIHLKNAIKSTRDWLFKNKKG